MINASDFFKDGEYQKKYVSIYFKQKNTPRFL